MVAMADDGRSEDFRAGLLEDWEAGQTMTTWKFLNVLDVLDGLPIDEELAVLDGLTICYC